MINDDGDYVMETPLFDSAPTQTDKHLPSTSPVMAIVGMGSRSSPIVIDDDGDDCPIPLKVKATSSSSSSVKGKPCSSPIVIDDDDHYGPIPPKVKADPSLLSSVKGTPPQQSAPADIAPARDTTPARQEKPDQLKSGKGYSMLIRMGYRPGYGLGVNLEGICNLSSSLLGG